MQIGLVMSGCRPGGGGELLTLRTVELLTEAGYSVVLYAPEPIDLDAYSQFYGSSFGCRIFVPKNRILNVIPAKYRTIPRDFILKRKIHDDLFFDLSPTVIPTYTRLPDLAYFHWLPLLNPLRLENRRGPLDPKWGARKLFTAVWKWNVNRFLTSSRTVKLANSDFTRRELLKLGLNCQVVYPPVDVSSWRPPCAVHRDGVVSVARFSPSNPNKHHEWQLQIMEGKSTTLLAFGGCSTLEEMHHLEWLKENAPSNVTLSPNESYQRVRNALWSSKVFLHTAEEEAFGMTIVEAIAAGCIPLVYDAGGPREIVVERELRFNSVQEAREKVNRALAGEYDELLPSLKRHIQLFDVTSYTKRFLALISGLVSTH
jgi:glycosyltransferase involved in cell wall biosynthesis